jgi:hypothetical protein
MVLDIAPIGKQSQCHNSPSNGSLLSCSTIGKANPFQSIPEIGKYWDNLTNPDPGWWRALGYFGYMGSELIPNSLGLGREAVL